MFPLIGAIASIGSSLIGNIASAGDRDRAEAAYQAALEQIKNMGSGPDLARAILLKEFKSAGVLTPKMEQAVELAAPKVSQIQEDSTLKDAQMKALQGLQARGAAGFTPEERAQFNKSRQDVQRDAEAKRQQILQSMQARGQSGGGAELAAQLSAAQAGTDRASEESDRITSEASQRALQAIMGSGQLGGSIRAQDFDVAKTKAGSEDEFALRRFNEAVGRQQRNVGSENAAQQYNLSEAQRLSDANTSMANQELIRQRQAEQQMWDNEFRKRQATAQALQASGQQASQAAGQTQQGWQNIGSGVASAAGAYANKSEADAARKESRDFAASEAKKQRDYWTQMQNKADYQRMYPPTRFEGPKLPGQQ